MSPTGVSLSDPSTFEAKLDSLHACAFVPPMGVPLSTNPCAFEATLDSIHAYAFVSPTGTVISVHAARSVAVASCECPVTCYS